MLQKESTASGKEMGKLEGILREFAQNQQKNKATVEEVLRL